MELPPTKYRPWSQKFGDAFRGVAVGVRGQSSFQVHVFCALVVIVVAALANVSAWQWSMLLLCITLVLVAELFNTALEVMARAIDVNHNLHLRDALDIASGAVLLAAVGAATVGAVVLLDALNVF